MSLNLQVHNTLCKEYVLLADKKIRMSSRHPYLLTRIFPIIFASISVPNPCVPAIRVRISSALSILPSIRARSFVVHLTLEILPDVIAFVGVFQAFYGLFIHREGHLFIRHFKRALIAHIFGHTACMVAVDHVSRYP